MLIFNKLEFQDRLYRKTANIQEYIRCVGFCKTKHVKSYGIQPVFSKASSIRVESPPLPTFRRFLYISMMKTGTKSILWGVHQFVWHPITVFLAWLDLYGTFPKPWELFCIIVHDIGYIGKEEMDGEDGNRHPELGAKLAAFFFGEKARIECLGHSRSHAAKLGIPTSRLCWADKWSPVFDPTHFYWLRGTLSGEINQYRKTFPRAEGESSLMWSVAFKSYVIEKSNAIWKGSQGNKDHQYHYNGNPDSPKTENYKTTELPSS